jgi:coenzyme Q-binding protein COQ10
MPHFTTERHVAHSAADMFALVADIERYPEFVPMCERLVIKGRSREGERETLVADMSIAYAVVRETFTTKVILDRPALAITADYIDGPFHHLNTRWTFTPEGDHTCTVRFDIDYEFKSRMLSAIMGAAFESAFRKFSEAFIGRADALYGAPAG